MLRRTRRRVRAMHTQHDQILDLQTRLGELWERTGDPALHRLSVGATVSGHLDEVAEFDPREVDELEHADVHAQDYVDWISTALMNCYRKTGDGHVFGLLYELNEKAFRQAILYRLRGNGVVRPGDVLQEVFLNIYRYPHRFVADRADAFRNWAHRIVRNTLLKALKGETRRSKLVALDEDLGHRPDTPSNAPDRRAADAESAVLVDSAFLLYLDLYWLHYQKLSERERFALRMVEIDGASYKETAAALGIRLENLKMVIFRGRRKILRGMHQSLQRVLTRVHDDTSLTQDDACATG